jgi:flagellar hook-associated protein 2
MGISSLGVGSNILTQDLLDQLRKADEASIITPIKYDIANEKDKQSALNLIDASMKNLSDSINELKNATLFDKRGVSIDGTSVEMSADANSDIQEFTLDVSQLATKEIAESGKFDNKTDTIADDDGSITISVGDQDFDIDYNDSMTLEDLKKAINDTAGDAVNATIAQLGDGDFRLFLTSANTGSNQDISIKDNDGNLSGTQLTDDLSTVQDGDDAKFKFNGEDVTRHDNTFDDLVTGYHITLKSSGLSTVNVTQNRDEIMKRVDSFVSHYNAAIDQLGKMTKSSTDPKERGIFSSSSTIRDMQATVEDMIGEVGGEAGTLYDYGFDVDRDGKLSVDKTVLNAKLDDNSANVEAFFSGGEYKNDDGSTTTLKGAFVDMSDILGEYTKYNATLDQFEDSISQRLSDLEESKAEATKRLDDRYETLKKKFTAYDIMISKLNSASDMFTQMINTQNSADK